MGDEGCGANAFERSYTLEGSAEEHRAEAIRLHKLARSRRLLQRVPQE